MSINEHGGPPEPGIRKMITIAEVAAMLNATTRQIYRWIDSSGFPSQVRLGPKMSRWYLDEVVAWQRSRKPPPPKRERIRSRKSA